jgi:competence protein ComEC
VWSAGGVSKTKKLGGPNPKLWPKAAARIPELAFRRAPLLAAACWFAVGESLARNWEPALLLLVAVCFFFALALVALRRSLRVAILPVAGLWIALGLWCAEIQPTSSNQDVFKSYADGLSRQVRGRVVRVREMPPPTSDEGRDQEAGWWAEKDEDQDQAVAGYLSVDLQVEAVEELTPDVSRMVPVSGGVRINIDPERLTGAAKGAPAASGVSPVVRQPHLDCGDWVDAPMRMKVAERYRDPGAWQYADYLLAQGIGTHASVRGSKLLSEPHASSYGGNSPAAWSDRAAQLQCRIYAAQSWASERMLVYVHSRANRGLPKILRLSGDDAGMLNAMLFGDRAGLNKTQRVGFERTGSFHLFVVSGMHVGLLAGLVFWLARRLKLRDWLATLLTITLTFAYALLTGFGAPVQRALFMTAVFLIARLMSRDRNVLNALGAAALAVLVWSPAVLFEASFQMTFLAIIAIGGIAVPLGERSFVPYARAAQQLGSRWEDLGMRPCVAQFRVMLRLWGESLSSVFGRRAYQLPALSTRWTLLGVGALSDRSCSRVGDGFTDGPVLPSGDDVRSTDEYVFATAGRSFGSGRGSDVLRCAVKPLGRGAARCSHGTAVARSHESYRLDQHRSGCRSAHAGTRSVGFPSGRAGLGFLLLGGAPVRAVGLDRRGGVTCDCRDRALAAAPGGNARKHGGNRNRRRTG